ncbi:hypothetical protein H101_07374 [Trichophyton interdigitale H6]|nr:hypothetical protein H101_07374 [Trichophyton interdigitale H6]
MSVEIEPGELGFKRPFTKEVTEILYLRNPNSDPVAFKVKTTAPKHYCVRPNSGRIEPGKQVEVQGTHLRKLPSPPPPRSWLWAIINLRTDNSSSPGDERRPST